MKEVTHEDWMKNPKPRWMWCWDSNEKIKGKGYVLCILTEKEMLETGTRYPVRTMSGSCYCHCAEIEEETTRLTHYELSQLVKCFGVDYGLGNLAVSYNCVYPSVKLENESLSEDFVIRYRQGEWMPATRETVLKWYGENSGSDIARFVEFIGWGKQ